MDPTQTLADLFDALKGENRDDALDNLAELSDWLMVGGAMPDWAMALDKVQVKVRLELRENSMRYGDLDITLGDDGTPDTVVYCLDTLTGESWTSRYDSRSVRDEDGGISWDFIAGAETMEMRERRPSRLALLRSALTRLA